MILPAMGITSEILPVFSRKPIFGYRAMAYSIMGIAGLGWIVWGHHMFQSGMNPILGTTFMISTMVIAVPSAIKTFNCWERCGAADHLRPLCSTPRVRRDVRPRALSDLMASTPVTSTSTTPIHLGTSLRAVRRSLIGTSRALLCIPRVRASSAMGRSPSRCLVTYLVFFPMHSSACAGCAAVDDTPLRALQVSNDEPFRRFALRARSGSDHSSCSTSSSRSSGRGRGATRGANTL